MKQCIICKIDKNLSEFYSHSQMADGHINKCKECCKKQQKDRTDKLKLDPQWVEKENTRCREKAKRLGTNSKTSKETRQKWAEKFPEKRKARSGTQYIRKSGFHCHHWSYNKEHWSDIIYLTEQEHKKAHRFLIYDQERMMYRRFDTSILLDSKKIHEEFIRDCIKNQPD